MRNLDYSDVDLSNCISLARDMGHHYTLRFLGADEPQRHVDHLITLYCDYLRRPAPRLLVSDVNYEKSAIYSMSVATDDQDNFDIVTAQGLNHCWDRFVTAKELFHAILDAEEFRSMKLDEHIEDALVGWSTPQRSVVSEGLAEFAAMEFLFPIEARRKVMAAQGPKDFRAIATLYRIPQVKVEQFLSEDYMQKLGQIHDSSAWLKAA